MKLELRHFTDLIWFSFLGLFVIFSLYFLGLDLIAERCSYIFGERPTPFEKHAGIFYFHKEQDIRLGRNLKERSLGVIVSFSFEGLVVFGRVVSVIRLRLHV